MCKEKQKLAYDEYIDLVHSVHNRRIKTRAIKEGTSNDDLKEA